MTTTAERIYYEIDGDSAGLDKAARRAQDSLRNLDNSFENLKVRGGQGEQQIDKFSERLARLKREAGDLHGKIGAATEAIGSTSGGGFATAVVGTAAAVAILTGGLIALNQHAAKHEAELVKVGVLEKEAGDRIKSTSETVKLAGYAWEGAVARIADATGTLLQNAFRGLFVVAMAWDDFIHGRGIKSLDEYAGRIETLEGNVRDLHTTFKSTLPDFDALHAAMQSQIEAEGAWKEATLTGSKKLEERLRTMEQVHAFELEAAQDRIALMKKEGATDAELETARTAMRALEVQQQADELEVVRQTEEAKRQERLKTLDLMETTLDKALSVGQTFAQESVAASKVLAAVEIALSAAAAGWKLAEKGGPWGWAAAIATWAAGAASAGWALSQAFAPPTKHPTPHIPGLNRQEAREERREDRRENREANQEMRVEVRYRHRHYDDATDDALRRNSPLSRAVRRDRNRSF